MTEGNYYEVPCTRGVGQSAFTAGLQDYPFSVGQPNVWIPKKSYFKIEMALSFNNTAVPAERLPLNPQHLTALADNACGNLYDNVYFRGGMQEIDKITQYAPQASALKTRLHNTMPFLKSMGSSAHLNESSFNKRVLASAPFVPGQGNTNPRQDQASFTSSGLHDSREMYRPFNALDKGGAGFGGPAAFAANEVSVVAATGRLTGTAPAAGVGVDFLEGMPLGNLPTGGPVLPGDMIIIEGVPYTAAFDGAAYTANTISVQPKPNADIVLTTNWFIVRSDTQRSPQGFNRVFGIWQPPLGIFDYDEELGAGDYRFQLNPNSKFNLSAVESKDPNSVNLSPYIFEVLDVKFYAYYLKKSIPDQVRNLDLMEISIDSKPFSPNLQFSVSASTVGIAIFIQDSLAGSSPTIPPSMFKVLNNVDLTLTTVQVSYANQTKPATNWQSAYHVATGQSAAPPVFTSNGILELQQRYHDTYEESGLDVQFGGCESLEDWLRRGPYYYFSFERDVNNKSTEVQINMAFSSQNLIPAGTPVFCASIYRKTVQMTTTNGLITAISTRDV
jgi:hypothetical protein